MGRSEVTKRRFNLPKAHLYGPFWVYWEPIKSPVAEPVKPNKVPLGGERMFRMCPVMVKIPIWRQASG